MPNPETAPNGVRVVAAISEQTVRLLPRSPACPAQRGIASTNASASCESFRFAPVRRTASGTPRPSQIRWRLLPRLARPVGFGPVWSPPYTARMEQLSTTARDQSIWSSRASQSVEYRTSEFAVTTQRIVLKVGVLKTRSLELLLPQIEGMAVEQPFVGRMWERSWLEEPGAPKSLLNEWPAHWNSDDGCRNSQQPVSEADTARSWYFERVNQYLSDGNPTSAPSRLSRLLR